MQAEYASLERVVKRLKSASHSDHTATSSDSTTLQRRRPAVFRDLLSRTICRRNLYHSAFASATVPRVLLPFHLDTQSVYVDCNEQLAHAMGLPREAFLHGSRVSQTIAPTNYQRCLTVVSVLASSPVLRVRDVPCYAMNSIYDIIVSLEYDDQASAPVKPRACKYVQMIFVHPRPLPVPTRPTSLSPSLISTPMDAVSSDGNTNAPVTSFPSSSNASLVELNPLPSSMARHSTIDIAEEETSLHTWPPHASLERPHAVIIEPLSPSAPGDSPDVAESKVMWVSFCDNDFGGVGSPLPFVSVDAPTVRLLFPPCDDPQPESLPEAASMMDSSRIGSDTPVVRYHCVG